MLGANRAKSPRCYGETAQDSAFADTAPAPERRCRPKPRKAGDHDAQRCYQQALAGDCGPWLRAGLVGPNPPARLERIIAARRQRDRLGAPRFACKRRCGTGCGAAASARAGLRVGSARFWRAAGRGLPELVFVDHWACPPASWSATVSPSMRCAKCSLAAARQPLSSSANRVRFT